VAANVDPRPRLHPRNLDEAECTEAFVALLRLLSHDECQQLHLRVLSEMASTGSTDALHALARYLKEA
jgi:hypothetical protein